MNPLVGTWRLVSWENRSVDGAISHPFGEDAAAARRRRTPPRRTSYCGRYECEGNSVRHHIELSLFPDWSGVEQERLVEVTGDRLMLSTRPMLFEGIQQSARLVWERV